MHFRVLFFTSLMIFMSAISNASSIVEIKCTGDGETFPLLIDTTLERQSFPQLELQDAAFIRTQNFLTLKNSNIAVSFDLNTGQFSYNGEVASGFKCEYSNLEALQAQNSSKSIKGTTDEGKRVLLSDDGTWKYIKAEPRQLFCEGIGLKLDLPVNLGDVFELFGEKFEVLEPEDGSDFVHAGSKAQTGEIVFAFKVSKEGIWYEKESSPSWYSHGKQCTVR